MLRKVFLLLLMIGCAQLVLVPRASAQTNNSCFATMVWNFPDAIPAGWFYFAPYPGTYAYLIASTTAKCAPGSAAMETPTDCPYCQKPISLATGNTYIQQTDLAIPGLGGGLRLVRRWNSVWPSTQLATQVGLFGPNWRSNFEEYVFLGSDGTMKYSRGDGSYWSFTSGQSPNTLLAPSSVVATLASGSTYWTVTFQNGEQRRFDNTSGSLTAIIDRNGNTTSLAYDGTNRLVTVTDPASRHLTFTYASGSSRLVIGVSSDVGLSLSYSYDTQNRLSLITLPDSSTINFTYNSQSLIASVTDSQGKVLESHTYDANGRGTGASQANGVNAVTVSYPQ